jgi:hypothetical protein
MQDEGTPADGQNGSGSARDRWWFTPVMWIAAGGAAVAFQWGPISGASANWLNWLVALAGVLLAIFGVVEGLRAWPGRHRAP